MSVTDKLTGFLGAAGDNPGMIATVTQIGGMFSDTPVVGSLGKAGAFLAIADAAIRAKTGGEHNAFSLAKKAVEAAGPKLDQIVELCMGAACKAPGKESGLQAAAAALKGHFHAGKELLQTGAKTAMAHVTSKGNKLG